MNNVKREQMKGWLEYCYQVFCESDKFQEPDNALDWLIKNNKPNKDRKIVLLKVAAIDSFYKTQLRDKLVVADRILTIFDRSIQDFEPMLIATIANPLNGGNGVYSFATKYCHWHNSNCYPIYDSLIIQILPVINERENFTENFNSEDIRDIESYEELKTKINELKGYLTWKFEGYREIDHALWIYGKYQFITREIDAKTNVFLRDLDSLGGQDSWIREKLNKGYFDFFQLEHEPTYVIKKKRKK